jgi:hypothetical protein
MRRCLSAVTCSLLGFGAACAANKQVAQTLIPAPLVTALMGSGGVALAGTIPNYSVAALPPGYPKNLVPTGPVKIVGGMTTGDETVAVFADSTRRLAAIFEQLFVERGFKRPAPTVGSGFMPGSGPGFYFCDDSATVSVAPLTGENRTSARVTYRRVRGRPPCEMHQPLRSADGLKLPELKPPAGARVGASHGGGGSSEASSGAEITGTNLVPAAIVAHYADQLVAAGWTAAPPAISDRVVAQYFEAKDALGAPWEGVLMASGGKTTLSVSLAMHPRVNR